MTGVTLLWGAWQHYGGAGSAGYGMMVYSGMVAGVMTGGSNMQSVGAAGNASSMAEEP